MEISSVHFSYCTCSIFVWRKCYKCIISFHINITDSTIITESIFKITGTSSWMKSGHKYLIRSFFGSWSTMWFWSSFWTWWWSSSRFWSRIWHLIRFIIILFKKIKQEKYFYNVYFLGFFWYLDILDIFWHI